MQPLLLALLLAADPAGVRPVGADGKPLNLDFETGTLKGWTADGTAFVGQPIKGNTVSPRRGDMKSNHQGQYWLGGYEKHGDKPTGTLTSVEFPVTHPWASFLVGGGPWPTTCVEVLAGDQLLIRASGAEDETMRRVAVDLTKHQGKMIRVRVVDKHTGHWGHVNFDDFRFHAEKPDIKPADKPLAVDDYKFSGQSPQDAAKNMTVPPGFSVKLFAGEPDVHQPVGFCLDDRGRLWVLEAYCYPKRKPHPGPLLPEGQRKDGDKILIFEDVNGDGTFDKKTTFLEGLNLASGIEVGFGGVWFGAAPYLMFIPDADRDDKPDGPPQILLDGWGHQDTHETLNSFVWGPDGWLYGCHGVFTHSKVGKPGTADKDRQPINAGVWRYHPTRHTFEVFAHGTSNPWGLDYNEKGDFFVEACVIPHLWHIVQGGRYERQAGSHFNPYTYTEIPTIAKHRHYVGATPHGGNNKSDSAGGGHAHSGLFCYQGGLWPKEYHGKLFMGNIHGHRINVDQITPKGSGYEGDRNPDFLQSHDRYCIIVAMHAGPDGNAFFCDWSDKQVCHRNEPEIWDRTNGRLFKIVHKDTKPVVGLDLQKSTDAELVAYQTHANDWYARHARRILQERASQMSAEKLAALKEELRLWAATTSALVGGKPDDRIAPLRALWVLHSIGGTNLETLKSVIYNDPTDEVRTWAIRLLGDISVQDGASVAAVFNNADGVRTFSSRDLLAFASVAQRLPLTSRLPVAELLVRRITETADSTLLPMVWYALEPLVANEPTRALKLTASAKTSTLLQLTSRRVGAIGTPSAFDTLVEHLAATAKAEHTVAYLRGLADGLKGTRKPATPAGWPTVYSKLAKSESAEVRSLARTVAVAFRDPAALTTMFEIAANPKASVTDRTTALTAVLDAQHNRTGGLLKALIADPAMRAAALRGMARWQDDGIPASILAVYPTLTAAEKRDAVNALASRPGYAAELLTAIAAKTVPAADVPAETIRQLRTLGDAKLNDRIAAVWGTVRESPAERKQLIASWRSKLTLTQNPDLSAGRMVYAKVCQQCHTLYGVGSKVGPEITGSNRGDLNYLLENIFDPSAVIPKEYAATTLNLADGRTVTGIVKEETATVLTIVTATETLTIPAGDVEKRKPSELSMMPDDLTKQLTEPDVKNLIGYLRHPQQVPMFVTPESAKEFFNGKDLSNWDGDKDVWKVENGEIVGKSEKGLKANTFLTNHQGVRDFKLTLKVKLVPNEANSGIQFRSVRIEKGEMRGPQADVGKGWWGKLYEESARGLLAKPDGDQFVKPGEWNEYVIQAVGGKVKTWINGNLCTDLDDDKLAKEGLVGLQVHSGGPTEVRFKDIKLEVIGK